MVTVELKIKATKRLIFSDDVNIEELTKMAEEGTLLDFGSLDDEFEEEFIVEEELEENTIELLSPKDNNNNSTVTITDYNNTEVYSNTQEIIRINKQGEITYNSNNIKIIDEREE